MPDCHTCLGEHNEALHAATLRVRAWLRQSLCVEELPERKLRVGAERFGDLRQLGKTKGRGVVDKGAA
jgi:hypothetical protein